MKIVGALLLAVTLFAGVALAQDKKDYPLQVQMGDITERTWAAMSYSWWASATINGVTYDAYRCSSRTIDFYFTVSRMDRSDYFLADIVVVYRAILKRLPAKQLI